MLLALHRIEAIADVRSEPYSRRFPHFSTGNLKPELEAAGIRYVFLGEELGARRKEKAGYAGDAVCFDRVAALPAFASGLARLREGTSRYRIALLCSEGDPLDCHRMVLVARHASRFANIFHILADGSLESHVQAEQRLLQRQARSEADLFLSSEERLVDAYTKRGVEIAWIENSREDSE